MFNLLLAGVKSFLSRYSVNMPPSSSPIPSTPRTSPTPPRQQVSHPEPPVPTHTGEAAARVLGGDIALQTIDRSDHISTARALIGPKDRALIDTVRATINSGGVPSAGDLEKLKKLAVKLQDHLHGEVQHVTQERSVFRLGGRREINFESLTTKVKTLTTERNDIQRQLTEQRTILRDNPVAARRLGVTPESVRGLEGHLSHINAQLTTITDRVKVKMQKVGAVGRYMQTPERREALVAMAARDPQLARSLAGDRNCTTDMLLQVAQRYGSGLKRDPEVIQALLSNPRTDDRALQHLLPGASDELKVQIASHKNAPHGMLSDMATAELAKSPPNVAILKAIANNENCPTATLMKLAQQEDHELLTAVAQNKNATIEVMNKILESPHLTSEVATETLKRVPDLRDLSEAVLNRFTQSLDDDHLKPIMSAEATRRADNRLAVIELATQPQAHGSAGNLTTERNKTVALISELRSVMNQSLDPDVKTALKAQITRLQEGVILLDQKIAPLERRNAINATQVSIRSDRDDIARQLAKINMGNLAQSGSRFSEEGHALVRAVRTVGEVFHGLGIRASQGELGKATVQSFARLNAIDAKVDRAMHRTLESVTRLEQQMISRGASSEALEFIAAYKRELTGISASNADLRLARLTQMNDKLQQALTDGKMSPSEFETLSHLGGSLRTSIETYRDGKDAVFQRMQLVQTELESRFRDGGTNVATSLTSLSLREAANRVDTEFRGLLRDCHDSEDLQMLREDAIQVIREETMPVLQTLQRQVQQLATSEKAQEVLGEKASLQCAELIQVQVDKLNNVGNPTRLAELRQREMQLTGGMNDHERNEIRLLSETPDGGGISSEDKAKLKALSQRTGPLTDEDREVVGRLGRQSWIGPVYQEVLGKLANRRPLDEDNARILGDVHTQVDNALARFNNLDTNIREMGTRLTEENAAVDAKAKLITRLMDEGGVGSSLSETKSLRIQVSHAVPGITFSARAATNFTVVRNPETGQVDIIKRHEAGLGVGSELSGMQVSGGLMGGLQTRWSFNTPEDAARFVTFLERGTPHDYSPPRPSDGWFAGVEASLEAELPVLKGLSVEAQGNVQRLSERNSGTGEERVTWSGSLSGKLSLRLGLSEEQSQTVARLDQHGLSRVREDQSDEARVGLDGAHNVHEAATDDHEAHLGLAVDLETRITYKNRSVSVNGQRTPSRDVTTTEVEVVLRAGMDTSQIGTVTKMLVGGPAKLKELAEKMGMTDRDTDPEVYVATRLAAALGGTVQVGAVLQVEFENGSPIGIRVGGQVRTESQVKVQVFGTGIQYRNTAEANQMTTVWMPKTNAGLERLEQYFMADTALFNRTVAKLGWNDSTEIGSPARSIATLRIEFAEKKAEKAHLNELREAYVEHGPDSTQFKRLLARIGGSDGEGKELLGQPISRHAETWARERGEHALLNELRTAYMADNSTFRGRYRGELTERGFGGNLVIGDTTVLNGRYLHEWEADWKADKAQRGSRRTMALDTNET